MKCLLKWLKNVKNKYSKIKNKKITENFEKKPKESLNFRVIFVNKYYINFNKIYLLILNITYYLIYIVYKFTIL